MRPALQNSSTAFRKRCHKRCLLEVSSNRRLYLLARWDRPNALSFSVIAWDNPFPDLLFLECDRHQRHNYVFVLVSSQYSSLRMVLVLVFVRIRQQHALVFVHIVFRVMEIVRNFLLKISSWRPHVPAYRTMPSIIMLSASSTLKGLLTNTTPSLCKRHTRLYCSLFLALPAGLDVLLTQQAQVSSQCLLTLYISS